MRRTLILAATIGLVAGAGASRAYAQSLYSRFLSRFDTNNDGKISRSEVPEGTLRDVFDRMAAQYQLDPKKTYTRAELEKALGGSTQSDGKSNGNGSRPRRPGGRPESGRSPSGSSTRTYRALVELPEQYAKYDKDGDGQIGLYEWPRERIGEFLSLDKNGDGFITASEVKPAKPREEPREQKKDKEGQAEAKEGDQSANE